MEKYAADLTTPKDTPVRVYFAVAHNTIMIIDRTERSDTVIYPGKERSHAAEE